jgi:two-component system nitrate/nitrite response regulator NarL
MQKKIIICDDHQLFLSGITEVLKKFGNNYDIVTFNNSESCKTYLSNNKVDVFICDLNIDNVDGFVLINELKNELTHSKIIILTAYFEEFLLQKAKRMGIHAFMKKESTADELISVIDSDISSAFYCNRKFNKATNNFSAKDGSISTKFKLSRQEKEIIKLIIDGKKSNEIASVLSISKLTVDTHRKNINRKLEISNSSSLTKFAYENNLFS